MRQPASFVFIDILALFRSIVGGRLAVPAFGLRPEDETLGRVLVFQSSSQLLDSLAPRLFDHALCFHRHSRFVPPIFVVEKLTSRDVSEPSATFRPPAMVVVGSGSPTPRLFDSSTS